MTAAAAGFFDKREAEQLARHFNICFHHALMYGTEHQLLRDSIEPFFATLERLLAKVPLITATIERESVFLEGHCVDKTINARKVVAHFKRAGIQSISFDQAITRDHLLGFLEIVTSIARHPNSDAMKKELLWRSIDTVRLNYIVFRKMTTDEEVIAKGSTVLPPGDGNTTSLTDLIRDPRAAARHLLPAGTDAQPQELAASVARLGASVRQTAGTVPSNELLEAILVVREECLTRVGDLQAARLGENAAVVDEVEKLTRDAVLGIVAQEYRAGAVTAKRLAQILRRMLPDPAELRNLLPHLKDTLLAEGMPFVKYVELVTELRRELEGDSAVNELAAATREMGVTAEEILEEIRTHPADAARLIILSSELRRTGGGNEAVFEQMFTDYIEQASRHAAIASADASNPDNGRMLGSLLQKMEQNLVKSLKQQGVEQSVLTALTARLAERLPYLLDTAKTDWLKKVLATHADFDAGMLAKVIAGTVRHAHDIDTNRDALAALFQEKGYTQEQTRQVLSHASRLIQAGGAAADLPKGVLSSNIFMYFLDRECKLSLRYHTPFSLLIMTLLRLEDGDGVLTAIPEAEQSRFLKKVVAQLKRKLRDIDVIGVSPAGSESVTFAILPMTEESKTYGLSERLRRDFSSLAFESDGLSRRLVIALSITGFDVTTMDNRTVFLKTAMSHHRAAEKILLTGIKQ